MVQVIPLLAPDLCARLSTMMLKRVEAGETTRDPQCPKSDALRDNPVLDNILEQLVPFLEEATGLRLHPTYCYARVYRPGEVLHRHTDRPACEVSITVTLGHEGGLWPIYVDGKKFMLEVGVGALYRGCEEEHWRNEYVEGEWQTQAFFHYVNAEGPFRDWRYDKRSKLAHH